ncbi:MAG: DUF5678 domain-containing protein [Chloroflexota bacterium]
MKQDNKLYQHIEPELQQNVHKVFQSMGITPEQAITIFYEQVNQYRRLPFALPFDHPLLSTLNGYANGHASLDAPAIYQNGQQPSLHVTTDYIDLYTSPDDELMLQEEAVFRTQQAMLQQQYPNEYVAIHQGEVIDHDVNDVELLRRRRKYGKKVVLIRHVDSDPDQEITIRSSRISKVEA